MSSAASEWTLVLISLVILLCLLFALIFGWQTLVVSRWVAYSRLNFMLLKSPVTDIPKPTCFSCIHYFENKGDYARRISRTTASDKPTTQHAPAAEILPRHMNPLARGIQLPLITTPKASMAVGSQEHQMSPVENATALNMSIPSTLPSTSITTINSNAVTPDRNDEDNIRQQVDS